MALTDEDLKQVGSYVQSHLIEWLPKNVIDLSERTARLDERLEKHAALMQQGFNEMEKRFEQVDRRFEQVDKRFDDLQRHSNRWMTVLTVMVGLIGVAVTVTNLMG
jgi:predicted RNase H-like nuclease (RuvC/YqgF family)